MISNNIKIAWRTLQKNKIYTVISIAGLAIGVAATMLIFRIVHYESGFNKNFKNYEHIGRIVSLDKNQEGESHNVCVPTSAMDVIEDKIAEFDKIARIREVWSTLTVPNPEGGAPLKKYGLAENTTAFFTEPSFFEIFDLQWIEGNPTTALEDPNTIVITESWAEKCFDKSVGILGETLLVDNLVPVKVTGVIQDLPGNCDFNFPFLISYPTLKNHKEMFFYLEGWNNCSSNNQLYVLLNPESHIEKVDVNLATVGAEEYQDGNGTRRKYHSFQPISMLHYDENYSNSGTHRTSKTRLGILSGIGILILLMACFNFINLTTAQSTLRSKEVGVRKTLGSSQFQLTTQFMTETALIVILAMISGIFLASIAAPLLKHISDVPDALPFLSHPSVLSFILITTLAVILLSGLYPALSLARYKPLDAIRNRVSTKMSGGAAVRKILVVLQFSIAQALIIAALINILQLDYIRKKDLGFADDQVFTFTINNDSLTVSRQNALKNRLQAIPSVRSVSLSSDQPLSGNTWSSNFGYSNRPEDERFPINVKFCDADYQNTYGLRLLAGRWLNQSDTMREVVLNKITLMKLGITNIEEAIGETITFWNKPLRIVGIVDDFHQHSLKDNFQPLVFTSNKEMYWETGVKISPDHLTSTTREINQIFDEVFPEQIFNSRFLDESIARFYRDDQRLSATTKFFGFLAIVISCLGLFGLATHAAAQRIKEIGVRKVLGASITSIVLLLSKDFLKLVGIALIVASPVAAYFMSRWLQNFKFHIPMPWWVFILTGFIALFIALVTVGYQGVRAASVNPIQSLKDE